MIEAGDKSTPTAFRAEFSWTPEEAERADEVVHDLGRSCS